MKYVGRHRRVTDPSYHLVQGRPACNIHRFEFVCFDFYLPVFVVLFLPKSICYYLVCNWCWVINDPCNIFKGSPRASKKSKQGVCADKDHLAIQPY
jgi:hypothetical protein